MKKSNIAKIFLFNAALCENFRIARRIVITEYLWRSENMKRKIICSIAAFVIMALLPFLSMGSIERETAPVSDEMAAEESSQSESTTPEVSSETERQSHENQGFRILDTSSGKIVNVDEREFCCGALGYEMAPLYEIEALKAQCVACYTHFCMLREKQRSEPDPDLKGADFSADLSKSQIWLSNDQMKKKWGDLYERSRQRIDQAVDECFGEVLCDDKGKLIDAAYFALSSGNTENASDIFGFDSPYLRAAPSPFDLKAPDQTSETTVSAEKLCSALTALKKDFSLPDKKDGRIGTAERTPSGTVLKIKIGSQEFTGAEIRNALNLRSANFDIDDEGDSFVFTTRGYGHGVGLSQYGANALAQQGSDYQEILHHYYGSASIEKY